MLCINPFLEVTVLFYSCNENEFSIFFALLNRYNTLLSINFSELNYNIWLEHGPAEEMQAWFDFLLNLKWKEIDTQ